MNKVQCWVYIVCGYFGSIWAVGPSSAIAKFSRLSANYKRGQRVSKSESTREQCCDVSGDCSYTAAWLCVSVVFVSSVSIYRAPGRWGRLLGTALCLYGIALNITQFPGICKSKHARYRSLVRQENRASHKMFFNQKHSGSGWCV